MYSGNHICGEYGDTPPERIPEQPEREYEPEASTKPLHAPTIGAMMQFWDVINFDLYIKILILKANE